MAKAKAPSVAPSQAAVVAATSANKAKRHAARMEKQAAKVVNITRGTARAKRRVIAAGMKQQGQEFRDAWAEFRKVEKPKAIVA